ncbi:Alpha/Beta hydrolase protein [Limtongia smithiae]|uniref:Alpha/Beta hydrolase protein n=1 Tax=Limtongia smithiae TaxID=1125753 RepID=UPI0034CF9C35
MARPLAPCAQSLRLLLTPPTRTLRQPHLSPTVASQFAPHYRSSSTLPTSSGNQQTSPLELQYLQFDAPASVPENAPTIPPIVVLHGFLGSKQNNRSVCKRFAADLYTRVYALDLRNHGDSPHVRTHDYLSLALDVEHFIDTQIQEKHAVVLGHSMGAKTAMAVALRRPELVDAVVAVDNAPIDAALSSDIPRYVDALRRIERMGLKSVNDAFAVLGKYETSVEIRRFLLTNAIFKSDGTVGFRVPLDILARALDHVAEFPFNSNNDRFAGPALFVRGSRSHYVPDESIPTIGRFFPRFVLKDVDAGHWLISERTTEFIDIVEDFLRNLKD